LTLFWGLMLIAVAFLSRDVSSVMDAAFSLVSLTSGALLGGIVLSLALKRKKAWPVITGMIASLGGMILVHSTKTVYWPWYTLIGAAILFLLALPLFQFAKRKPEVET
ncbi:MAG: hypothetical protein CBC62_08360, partial [Opitutia bacterium TMED102]